MLTSPQPAAEAPAARKRFLTLHDVAGACSVSYASVYKMVVLQRRLPFYRIAGTIRVDQADLDKFLAEARG